MPKLKYFALLLFAGVLLSGCLQLEPPKVTYLDTQINVLSLNELLAKSKFDIKNPNPVGIQGSVEYEIMVDGKPFTSGITSTIEMTANGQATFIVASKIDLVQLYGTAQSVMKILSEGKSSIPYAVSGKFRSSVVGVPIEAPVKASGDIPLPKLSEIKIKF